MKRQHTVDKPDVADKLLRVLFFTLIISVMNASMYNVVLPRIRLDFHLSASQVSWVVTGYLIIYAVGAVMYGKLADKYKLKNLLTFGLTFFALGSLMGMIASEYWMLIAGRMMQAAGAAVIPAIAMIIPIRYFSPEKRGLALGTSAVGMALGNALAPIVGGLVTSVGNWRVLFGLSIIILLTLPFFRKYLGDEQRNTGRIDYLGGVLLGGTVSLLMLSITYGNSMFLIFGLVLFVLFILRIRFAVEPFIELGLFRNKAYTMGLIITLINTGVVMGIPFLTPQLLANVNQLSPASIGFVMFPAALASALMGRRGGKLADAKGNSLLVYTAISLLLACFTLLSLFAGMSPIYIMLILILGNLGQTFMQISLSNTISQTLVKEQVGVGMGLFSMNIFIAGAISTVVIGKILDFDASSTQWNPFLLNRSGLVYSNIFVVCAVLVCILLLLYYLQFGLSDARRARNKSQPQLTL
ncbi:MFS transporter [Paenibacillus sp. SYP-B3998]|uniref:MFS transporter n=1 Tax=Paenibacillus sp. SYP-B3998 TaxID=2678564 RepID=A0A6G4A0J0_9BACL|nr:MFS transporter [Paenibacillus sp. SYP-B3998]NEW07339.1 MFS transporter [Paenibacillus sp. SYP-B3998]